MDGGRKRRWRVIEVDRCRPLDGVATGFGEVGIKVTGRQAVILAEPITKEKEDRKTAVDVYGQFETFQVGRHSQIGKSVFTRGPGRCARAETRPAGSLSSFCERNATGD